MSKSLKTQIAQTQTHRVFSQSLTLTLQTWFSLCFKLHGLSQSHSLSLFKDSLLCRFASLCRLASLCHFIPQTLILGGSTGRDYTFITSKDSLSLSLSVGVWNFFVFLVLFFCMFFILCGRSKILWRKICFIIIIFICVGFLILLVIILEMFFIPNTLKYRIWVF